MPTTPPTDAGLPAALTAVRTAFPAVLTDLGCARTTRANPSPRRLSARWADPPPPPAPSILKPWEWVQRMRDQAFAPVVDAAVADSLVAEMIAEFTQDILWESRRHPAVPVHTEPTTGFLDRLWRGFERIGPDGFAIVTPYTVTLLRDAAVDPDDLPVVWPEHGRRAYGLAHFYVAGRTLVIDAYASDRTPVLFCRPGWATIGYDTLAQAGDTIVDAQAGVPVTSLMSDLLVEPQPAMMLSMPMTDFAVWQQR